MMTRKDYIAVSNILREYRQSIHAEDYADLVADFGAYMLRDNDRFDFARFSEACNMPVTEYPEPKPASSHVALA
jgi:hypothetical protein